MTSRQALDWRLVGIFYVLIAGAFIVRALLNSATMPLIADTDDAMRLVVVRDFLAGQGWYDNVQHRMNTPIGAELHWSRLADLPLAALILVFRPLFGAAAETAAAYLLPLIYLFGLLFLSGKVTVRLVGSEGLLPALALPALSLSVLGEFAPGRIDHHGLQVLLLLAMLWCAIETLDRPRFALGAGLAAATSLALGVEGIPSVAAAILAFGLMWVTLPHRADALRSFGISFALGTLVHLIISLPPERWLVPACDAISFTYAAAAAGTGLAFLVLAALPLRSAAPLVRLAAGIAAGAVLALLLAIAFPLCLGGPYAALDPWLTENWLDKIGEALPLWQAIGATPVYSIAVAVPPLLALAVVRWLVTRGPRQGRDRWLVYAVFLILALATMLIQIRASRMVTGLAVPACAWLILAARHRYLARPNLSRIAALLASWLASAGMAVALVVLGITHLFPGVAGGGPATSEALGDRRQCVMPDAFASLAAIPPERLMTPVDLGSHMLAFTPHHVVAAPYHRNEAGVRDAFAFFNGPIEAGRDILERRGVTLVVTCAALPEMRGLPDAAADSFVRLAPEGALPAWLVETGPPGETLRVYAVMPR